MSPAFADVMTVDGALMSRHDRPLATGRVKM